MRILKLNPNLIHGNRSFQNNLHYSIIQQVSNLPSGRQSRSVIINGARDQLIYATSYCGLEFLKITEIIRSFLFLVHDLFKVRHLSRS